MPASKGRWSSRRRAHEKASFRVLMMSPLAFDVEVRVKKSMVPSGERRGRYSSSSQLTSGMGTGA